VRSGSAQGLPHHYRGISEQHLPTELFPGVNVVEHELSSAVHVATAPVCLFVLDLCVSDEDMDHIKVCSLPLDLRTYSSPALKQVKNATCWLHSYADFEILKYIFMRNR
jgi:hypothetical protein